MLTYITVLLSQSRLSSAHAAEKNWKRKPSADELPALRQMSDLLWAMWSRDNPNIKNLHYLWAQSVSDARTTGILASALKAANRTLDAWPGTTFNITSDDGAALLGSPSAYAFANLLVAHKEELGNKKITKVIAFQGSSADTKAEGEEKNPELGTLFHSLFFVQAHN